MEGNKIIQNENSDNLMENCASLGLTQENYDVYDDSNGAWPLGVPIELFS